MLRHIAALLGHEYNNKKGFKIAKENFLGTITTHCVVQFRNSRVFFTNVLNTVAKRLPP